MTESVTVAMRLGLNACPLCEISKKTGVECEVIKQMPCNGKIAALVQVHGDGVDKLLDALFPCDKIEEAILVNRGHEESLMRLVFKHENCFFISLAEDTGILARDILYSNGAIGTFWLRGKEEFKTLVNYLGEKGVEFEILRVTRSGKGSSELTTKQMEILKYAFENGYFEKYRKASLKEVADHFELGISTTCVHLRTATKKVVKNFFQRNMQL